ncbi:MAG: MFS transporter [Clostridia bacterium]|nr:MFS transporter [Clostridia bacterium]
MKQYRRWFSWGILVFAFVIVFFHRLSIGAVSDLMTADLELDNIQLANLTAMTFYAYALMQIPVGIFVDSFGVRKLCSAGMMVTAVGSILLGFSSSIVMAYFSRFLVGLGTSVIIVSIMKIQATLFPAKMYSRLSGMTSFFGNLGAFFATFPLAYMAMHWGWRSIFIILGVLTLILSVLILTVVRERSDHHKTLSFVGEDVKRKNLSATSVFQAIRRVLVNKATWPNFFAMVFFVGSLTAVLGLWGVRYLSASYDMTTDQAAYYLSFITYGFIGGAPLVGHLSDKVGGHVKRILLPATILYAGNWFYILVICGGVPPRGQLPMLFFAMGLCSIAHILIFTNVKEVNLPEHTGIATSIINVGEFVGGGLISYGIGAYIEKKTLVVALSPELFKQGMMVVLVAAVLSILSVACMKSHKNSVGA